MLYVIGFESFANPLLNVFVNALKGLNNSDGSDKKSITFYGRILAMAVAGGVPIYLLDKQKDFPIKSTHFNSIGLPLNLSANTSINCEEASDNYQDMKKVSDSKHFNKSILKTLFWNPTISDLFKSDNCSWETRFDLDLKTVLNLESSRISDIVIISTKFDHPILIVEISDQVISNGSNHEAFMKLMTTLSISCIELADKMKKSDLDPVNAKTFGLLIGFDKVHILACFPQFVPSKTTGSGKRDIYTCVYMHDHWFLDFTELKKGRMTNQMDSSLSMNFEFSIFNENSYRKLFSSISTIKESIETFNIGTSTQLSEFEFGKPRVFCDTKSNTKKDEIFKKESKFYSEKLSSYFNYPKSTLQGSDLKLEELIPLVGNGIIGNKGCLCPGVVRSHKPEYLIMDAAIFAIHALFGLHVLHEQIGHVHGNITPNSVKFSVKEKIWKLTEFGFTMPVEAERKIGSSETIENGIYNKSTDVYALGKVLWNTFYIQITCLIESQESTTKTRLAYDKLAQIIFKMISEDLKKRLSVLEAMKLMYKLIKENEILNFEIYGKSSIMTLVECLL